MFSITLFLISIVCIILLVFLYYILINKTPETPTQVYGRISKKQKSLVTGFTYAKRGDLYENYKVPIDATNFELIKTLDKQPMNFDGSFYTLDSYKHGIITENNNGFKITGINADFNCPPNWNFKDGKCQINDICKSDDVNVFRGVDYYFFRENILDNTVPINAQYAENSNLYHPRLYMHCKQGNTDPVLKSCPPNELFRRESKVDGNLKSACIPYDVCQDKINNVKHNYPISEDELELNYNEYYICRNRESVEETCPPTNIFDINLRACISEFVCRIGEFFTIKVDDNSYIKCNNRVNEFINCSNGVFETDNKNFECLDPNCSSIRQTIFKSYSNIRFPFGYTVCLKNKTTQFLCSDETRLITGNLITQIYLEYRENKYFINNAITIPKYIYDETVIENTCITSNDTNIIPYITNKIVNASYNAGFPSIPYDFINKTITFDNFSEIKNLEKNSIIFCFGHSVIFKYDYTGNSIIKTEIQNKHATIAPFTILNKDSLDNLKYSYWITQLKIQQQLTGNIDYIPYVVFYVNEEIFENNANRSNLQYKGYEKLPDNKYFNAYTQQPSDLLSAHDQLTLAILPFNKSYLFQYRILYYISKDDSIRYPEIDFEYDQYIDVTTVAELCLGIWTEYGAIRIECKIIPDTLLFWKGSDKTQIPSFNFHHKTLPIINDVLSTIQILQPRYYSAVTPVYKNFYKYKHIPICLQYIQNIEILLPSDARSYDIDKIFKVHHNSYYENYDENLEF
ncbi:VP91/95 [Tipula oleracea nudivirus]|uniref:VP91/95 n=1 Tax=Tipula oleracea nudivirus TaxID=1546257 RepID=A0A0B4VG26_9VIRU|nr:VP91/95 [Tipula oleracea nudivirus]AJD20076.1 VP91/95 [Tipula oleracea nudivirus]